MNSKEYLEEAIRLSQDISAHLAELDRLSEISTASGAICYENDRVISSVPQTARFENAVIRLVDLRKEVQTEIMELLDKHREIRNVILQVQDEDARNVLRMKYLALKSVGEIMQAFQISKPTVFKRLDVGYHEVSLITGFPEPQRPKQRMPARDRHAQSRKLMREAFRRGGEE